MEIHDNIRRHFLPWDRPLLPQAVAFLAADWEGAGPLDLSRVMVVVPTRQAGRRLRAAIAEFAAARGHASFAPRVVTPEVLIGLGVSGGVASPLESLLAWTHVLCVLDLERFRAVFPIDPAVRNVAWGIRLARELLHLQATLAEAALTIADVAPILGDEFPEIRRWRELGAIEQLYVEQLRAMGRLDPQVARIAAARAPSPAGSFKRIVMIATPDPMPLALSALESHARTVPVDVVVFARGDDAAAFDSWGRPVADVWARRQLDLAEFEQRVHLCAHPAGQAERVAAIARNYAQPDGLLGVGIADDEITPLLENELSRGGQLVFNPAGSPRRMSRLYHLLTALASLVREPTFEAVATIARCPDFLTFLRAKIGPKFSVAFWLAALDALRSDHLPPDVVTARAHAGRGSIAEEGLATVAEIRDALLSGEFPDNALAVLTQVFGVRQLDLAYDPDARLERDAAAWTEVLRECSSARKHFPALTTAEWWDLASRQFGDGFDADEKPPGAVELQGWLELLWDDAPHLAVAGINDGAVPAAIVGHVFLPDSLRQRLGLKNNASRFARDAYIMQAIVSSRSRDDDAARGRVEFFFGKTSTVGDPLRPSRLLLQCAERDLPSRVAFLFRAPEIPDAASAWTRTWRLVPRSVVPPSRIAVTALRNYLRCPFRFYLRHAMRLEQVDATKNELDARDFGTLCHGALERMARDPALRTCTDPSVLCDALLLELEQIVRQRYGGNLALPLVIQLESARQRLAKAAELEAAERAAGWVIERVETEFAVEIGGIEVRGKIDRIDRHGETGALRVLDYKTTDRAMNPANVHLRAMRLGESAPGWARFDLLNKPRIWADLQLPLYLHALKQEGSIDPEMVRLGYFNLPKAVGETGVTTWNDYTPLLHEAAMRCAEGVCGAIREGKFWPPNEAVNEDYDEFAALFHHGAEASIDPVLLLTDAGGHGLGPQLAPGRAPE